MVSRKAPAPRSFGSNRDRRAYLVVDPRSRLIALLVGLSVMCLGFVGHQLLISDLVNSLQQSRLRDSFAEPSPATSTSTVTTSIETSSTIPSPTSTVAAPPPEIPPSGEAFARISAPSISLDVVTVQDAVLENLKKGPGHFAHSAGFGESGNMAFGGHRTTYGAPFEHLDEINVGDPIDVAAPSGLVQHYVAMSPSEALGTRLGEVAVTDRAAFLVTPDDVWVTEEFGDRRLTMLACHPKRSAQQRIVVAARRIDVDAPSPSPTTTNTTPSPDVSSTTTTTTTPVAPTQSSTLSPERATQRDDLLDEAGDPNIIAPLALAALFVVLWMLIDNVRRHHGYKIAIMGGIVLLVPMLWLLYGLVEQVLPTW